MYAHLAGYLLPACVDDHEFRYSAAQSGVCIVCSCGLSGPYAGGRRAAVNCFEKAHLAATPNLGIELLHA